MAAAAAATPSTLAVVLLCAAAAAFFTTAHAKTADGDFIAKTCANVTRPDRSIFLPEKFCNSRLRMDKRSAAAKHPQDLALIAMDLTQHAVADADAKVDGLLRSGVGNSSTPAILRNCRMDYAAVASSIPVCRAMAEDYKKKPDAGQLKPREYFQCSRWLKRNTSDCLDRIYTDSEASYRLFEVVGDAWLGTVLVEVMLEEMLGVVTGDN